MFAKMILEYPKSLLRYLNEKAFQCFFTISVVFYFYFRWDRIRQIARLAADMKKNKLVRFRTEVKITKHEVNKI